MLSVGELRQMCPLHDIFVIQPDTRYLVRLPASMPMNEVKMVFDTLALAKVNALILRGDDIQFFNLKETLST